MFLAHIALISPELLLEVVTSLLKSMVITALGRDPLSLFLRRIDNLLPCALHLVL